MANENEVLDMIVDAITSGDMEAWFEGRTLTVMLDDQGTTRFAKLRLARITDRLSPADLRGEPA